jgi:hypothetical protein
MAFPSSSTLATGFAQVDMPEIVLPSPPFTPASLHFVLGYLYAGNLAFSNRTFDLSTAFSIRRAALFLEIDVLAAEIDARIVWEFCHGMQWETASVGPTRESSSQATLKACRCKRCTKRIPRVWRFANAPDVRASALANRARRYLITGWGFCWGKEVFTADPAEVDDLLHTTLKEQIAVVDLAVVNWKQLASARRRLAQDLSTAAPSTSSSEVGSPHTWHERLNEIYDNIESALLDVTLFNLESVLASQDFQDIIEGKGFDTDLLEHVLKALEDSAGALRTCRHAGSVYQVSFAIYTRRQHSS